MRVLIVDDVTTNQRLLARILTHYGHESEIAGSGAEALTMLAEGPFDLVFMDVQMPVMDGLETTRRIRAEHADSVRIVGLSGFAGDDALCASQEAGMDGYLSKPFSIPAIIAILTNAGA